MPRGTLDIIANILIITQEEQLEYDIMKKCNLNNRQFNHYIKMLLRSGLLNAFPVGNMRHTPGYRSKRRMFFQRTESGKRFLELYSELYSLASGRWSVGALLARRVRRVTVEANR